VARRYTEEAFRNAVADPHVRTLADLCRALGIVPRGGNYETIRRYAASIGLELTEHLPETVRRTVRHPLELPDDDTLRAAVAANRSVAGVLRELGWPPTGAAYRRLRAAIQERRIPTDHHVGQGWAAGTTRPERQRPLAELLTAESTARAGAIRKRLIAEGLKEHRCEDCRRTSWRGRPIPLELDHINGDRHDNRLENLRLLCPNCHALTPTYRGRNIGRYASATTSAVGPPDPTAYPDLGRGSPTGKRRPP
jgi:hypothetical protein